LRGVALLCSLSWACVYPSIKGYTQQSNSGKANLISETDTSYVKPYGKEITARLFLSQKYTSIQVPGSSTESSFSYKPNTRLNLGIGATYRSFTFNLAYGVPWFNADNDIRGKTNYIDLQAHLYGRKLVIDFFGQFYKGYYLSPKDYIVGFPGYYIKPDLGVRMIGASAYYVFNNRKFSYRASLLQSEWQARSAGTFLLGGDVSYGVINSDFVLIPPEVANQFPQGSVKRIRFLNIGPGGGYAYTFVYKRNWFATGSLTVNLPIDFVKENAYTGDKDKISFSPNYIYRLALGYNSRRWIYTLSLVNGTVNTSGSYNEGNYRIRTGNYRLTVAKRFTLNRKAKKAMNPVDKVLEVPKEIGK
jgi:hypothetical protein